MRSVRRLDSTGTYRTSVGARTRLGQTEGGELAIANSGQVFGFLFRSAEQKYTLKCTKLNAINNSIINELYHIITNRLLIINELLITINKRCQM